MKPAGREPTLRLALDEGEICVDYFAGGGGASTGMDEVLSAHGRHVDIAINHNAEAIALHKVNHPNTEHFVEDVFDIDIVKAVRGRKIGFAWYSPDCTFHSKARGGKPFRDRNKARRIRGLAWVIHKHIKLLGKKAPRVLAMENVQEFADWGPLDDDGKIIELKKGMTFRRWCKQLSNLGYELDMWTLKGCDYGAPTTRERLFIVARRDGLPITKPQPTHGPGRALPYRTAAECIDFTLPCPSIFDRARPLADNTLRRIAEGIRRFVINNPKPFIVPVAHQGDSRANSIDEPLRTVTAERRGDFALVEPLVVAIDNGSSEGRNASPAGEPLRTITTENRFALAAPVIVGVGGRRGQSPACSVERPHPTTTAKADAALLMPFVTKFRQNSIGSKLDEPLHTVTSGGDMQRPAGAAHAMGLVTPLLVGTGGPAFGGKPQQVDKPLGAALTENHRAVVAPVLVPRYGERPAEDGKEGQAPRVRSVQLPLPTIVTTDNGAQLVAATLLKQNGVDEKMVVGQPLTDPLHTITTSDQKAVMTSHLCKLRHHSTGQPLDQPIDTIAAGGTHYAEVRALLIKFYSEGGQWGSLHDPMGTVTTKDRLGLVTVMIQGEEYAIVDIGLRMLTPRELFKAQGFPERYEIERDQYGQQFSKTAQVRMCGNSVCPPVASAVIRAQLEQPTTEEMAA